jgi:hypothetical protein
LKMTSAFAPGRNGKGEFLKGHKPIEGTGRPRGSRAKLCQKFIEEMHDDFLEHGVEAIERVRKTRPVSYLQIIASIVPKDVNVAVSAVENMTDNELTATIRRLSADPDVARLVALAEVQEDTEFEGTC